MTKIGCISPSVVIHPWDLDDLLPVDVNALVVTLNNRNGMPGSEERSNAALPGAVDVLADEGAQTIVAFGIPNAARRGYEPDRQLFEELGRARNVAIVSSLHATILACRHLGAQNTVLVTQYDEVANGKIVTYCRAAGLPVLTATGLGCRNAAEVNAKSASDYDLLARVTLHEYPQCDALVLFARGNLAAVAQAIERDHNLPVIEQTQATVWWSLSTLGQPVPVPRTKLLASGAASAALSA